MLLAIRNLTCYIISLILLSAIAPTLTQAQTERICETDGDYEPASSTTRSLELRNIGIRVAIPENYRAMLQQDGSVAILHPDDFTWIQCLVQGGRGGHGYYSEHISLVSVDPSMSLREQATWTGGYSISRDGTRIPGATSVTQYQQNGLDGFIVTSISGYSVTFLGTIPNSNQLLKVTAGCDCEVDAQAVTDLLSRIRPL